MPGFACQLKETLPTHEQPHSSETSHESTSVNSVRTASQLSSNSFATSSTVARNLKTFSTSSQMAQEPYQPSERYGHHGLFEKGTIAVSKF